MQTEVAKENKKAAQPPAPIPQTAMAPAEPNLPVEATGSWGAEDADASDIIIPRVLLMQGLSDFVKERKAMAGDIVNSLTKKVIGSFEEPLEVIPIMRAAKVWIVDEELTPKTWTFKERLEWSPANSGWESKEQREVLVNGVMTRRTLCLDYFVLLPTDMDGLPFLISFRKTSFNTGKQMSTYFTECRMKKKPPANTVFTLSCHEKSKDKNSWFVFDLAEKRRSSEVELKAAFMWFNTLRSIKVKVDQGEDKTEPEGDAIPF